MVRIITVAFGYFVLELCPFDDFVCLFCIYKPCAWHNSITHMKILTKLYNSVFMHIYKKWPYYIMALSIYLTVCLSINILVRAITQLLFRISSCKYLGICIRSGPVQK